jgi:hypothetical protein
VAPAGEGFTVERALGQALDELFENMSSNKDPEAAQREVAFRTAAGVGLTLSAGFLSWLLRAGSLLASALTTMPLWKGFDPLPVLAAGRRRKRHKHAVADDAPAPPEADEETGLQEILDPDEQKTQEDKEKERASEKRDEQ